MGRSAHALSAGVSPHRRHAADLARLVRWSRLDQPRRLSARAAREVGRVPGRTSRGVHGRKPAASANSHRASTPTSRALSSALHARTPRAALASGEFAVRWPRSAKSALRLREGFPHPRIAAVDLAPSNLHRGGSRGFRWPSDITADYTQASCLPGRGARRPASPAPPRPCNHRYVKCPPRACGAHQGAVQARR